MAIHGYMLTQSLLFANDVNNQDEQGMEYVVMKWPSQINNTMDRVYTAVGFIHETDIVNS